MDVLGVLRVMIGLLSRRAAVQARRSALSPFDRTALYRLSTVYW